MTIAFRALLIILSVITGWDIFYRVRKGKLQIEYTLFWLAVAVLLIILAIFPQVLMVFSKLLGVQSPANLVFAFVIFLLIIKTFNLTMEISRLEVKVKELTQTIALDKKDAEE